MRMKRLILQSKIVVSGNSLYMDIGKLHFIFKAKNKIIVEENKQEHGVKTALS